MSALLNRRAVSGGRLARMCRRLYDNRLLKPFVGSRRRRRALVVAYALALVAFPLAGLLVEQLWAIAIVGLFYAVGTLMLAVATGGFADKPMGFLDERQRHIRRTLFGDPYLVGVSIGLASGLIVGLTLDASEAVSLGVFMSVFGAAFGLPSMIYAWSMPDHEDEDE